jgi:hypothetical protein
MLSKKFIATAKFLVPDSARRPNQANLRRPVSTCYYAVFHALAKMAADSLVGATKSRRPNKAWVEVYPGLGHGACKYACIKATNINFPIEIHDFADAFVQLQDARHRADYDPIERYTKEQALLFVALSERAISALRGCSVRDRRAFATWVLITSPGALQARKRARQE